jgi:hypothetical protein
MQSLIIEEKKSAYLIPGVRFDAQTGQCWLTGESYLENTPEFYNNLQSWLQDYITKIGKSIVFNLKLIYYNTSTQRALLELFWTLRDYHKKGGQVTVNWHYPEGDDEQVEEAEDYAKDAELGINLISY